MDLHGKLLLHTWNASLGQDSEEDKWARPPTPTPGPLPKLFSMPGMPSLSAPRLLRLSVHLSKSYLVQGPAQISALHKPSLTTLARNNFSLLSISIDPCVFWHLRHWPFYFGCVFTSSSIHHSVTALSSGSMSVPLWTVSPPWHLLVRSRHLVKISCMNKWLPQQWQKQKQLQHSLSLLFLSLLLLLQ